MASDNLTGRRKRGLPEKATAAPIPRNPFKPGTRAFGQEAEARRDKIRRRSRSGDLRVQTGAQVTKEERDRKNRVLMGD